MSRHIRFAPEEYRELSAAEQTLLREGYEHALTVVRRNITPRGFSACSLEDNRSHGTDVNYRSVWARDGAIVTIWTLDLDDEPDIRRTQRATLDTLLAHQTEHGQIPANVRIETNKPEYSGVGGIAAIDAVLWLIIACRQYAEQTGDWSIVEENRGKLQLAMDWLAAHDSNNCGLIEIPEASDWADLFGYSFHVLYDEVLWHRALVCYAHILDHLGHAEQAETYRAQAEHVKKVFMQSFWPTTIAENGKDRTDWQFTDTQYSLGDARYLVAQISPFSFSWRCDVYGNILAFLTGMIDRERAMMTFRFMWGTGVNDPGLVKNLYPPVQAGDPEWRDYYTVNLLNLPNHYHNGGIWPFIGGMWVRYLHKLGLKDLARRELVKLAQLCEQGVTHKWEFNEWHHGVTGRPMGKAFQAWSAASYLRACHSLSLDPDSQQSSRSV